MIDTINLRLSNVKSYPITKLRFEQTSKVGQTVVQVDQSTGECLTDSHIRALLHHDTSNIIPLTKRNAVHVPSSNYQLYYKYNIVSDCIDFEFAIPKYLYGTNVLQFIRYFGQDSETQYVFLMSFIRSFINKMTYEPINMADVSITRLDFCYNQFFNSRYDAIKYLDEQKKLLPKFARSTRNEATNYGTSLSYVTKRYSFKIYHKGTEFKKNDKRKLADKNPTSFDVDYLQDVSDRILRYEITFRKAQIDYLFREKELYKPYVNFFFSEGTRKMFRALQPQFYKHILTFCERGHNYVCAPVLQDNAISSGNVSFDKSVFNVLFTYFWEYVAKYQLQCKMSIMDVIHRIDQKNDDRDMIADEALRRKSSFNKNMLVVIATLTQFYSLEELRKSGLLPRTTFYRYQSKLKALGFVTNGKLVDVAPPDMGYLEYLSIFGVSHHK